MNASSEPIQAPVELHAPEMDLDLDPLTEFTQNSGFLEYFQYRFDTLPFLGGQTGETLVVQMSLILCMSSFS